MPFRLTRQFVSLMEPLRESGLIQSVMVHALRAFRAQPELLLNTMDVFVKEPSLDWKNFELKQLKKGGTWTLTVNTKEINWYPLQKVDFARRKLEGANPAIITSEELKLGFEKEPAFRGMQCVALGTEEHNVRARLPAQGLTVEQQVDCLLDQATDPNLLGRVWQGWEPWRYRFTSQSIIYIHNLIRFLYNVGDAEHLSKATVCGAVRKVCLAMKRRLPMFVVFPGHKPVRAIKEVLGSGLRG
ncbi:DNA-dependent protein kinase catalytic subunit [Merluccius polli]|uniref:DNA-dependent protein kinase catalytic subunit n=1 Tax=Merluccius polli TaxID=89951 RepID=A0AA47MRB2_MERPO|nr:DNA-dependent protein kinase catalytic subunit [Merluccius polli]